MPRCFLLNHFQFNINYPRVISFRSLDVKWVFLYVYCLAVIQRVARMMTLLSRIPEASVSTLGR
jgi:hypothetical protein